MDEDFKKHTMLFVSGIIVFTLLNIKLTSLRREKIQRPMRENVSIIATINGSEYIIDKEEDNEDDVKITNIKSNCKLDNKNDWVKLLNKIYSCMLKNEPVIVAVDRTELAIISSLIKVSFENIHKPIIIVSNKKDYDCAIKLVSKYTYPYIVSILDSKIIKPEEVSCHNHTVLGVDGEPNKEFEMKKSSGNIYYKKINILPTVNVVKLYPNNSYEKVIKCTMANSNGLVIDNTMGVDMVFNYDEEDFKIPVLVIGKKIKSNINIMYDPKCTVEYGIAKMYSNLSR